MSIKTLEQTLDMAYYVVELKTENKQLKERVEYLEEQNQQLINALIVAAKPPAYPPQTTTAYDKCLVCGLGGAMGYVCTRVDCPTTVRC